MAATPPETLQAPKALSHVHAGIHGGAGLDPAQHDWRNPGARLVVKTWTLSQ